jgi:hypothetical protein
VGKSLTERKGGAVQKAGSLRASLEKYAKEEAARIPAGSGGDYISIKGGDFTFKGAVLPVPLKVIVLNYAFENNYYIGKYDAENPSPPACFALSMNDDDLAPHETAPEPQHDTCKGCPQNEWGSADVGRGKACKNGRRLVLINADVEDLTPEYVAKSPVAMLKLPPSSLKHFDGHLKKITEGIGLPFWSVITTLQFEEDSDWPIVIPQFGEELTDRKLVNAIMAKRDEVSSSLMVAPDVSNYDSGKKGGAKKPDGKKPAPKGKGAPAKGRARF